MTLPLEHKITVQEKCSSLHAISRLDTHKYVIVTDSTCVGCMYVITRGGFLWRGLGVSILRTKPLLFPVGRASFSYGVMVIVTLCGDLVLRV